MIQVLVGVPGEFSTMAGRRIRAAVAEVVGGAWGQQLKVRSSLGLLYSACGAARLLSDQPKLQYPVLSWLIHWHRDCDQRRHIGLLMQPSIELSSSSRCHC